MSKKPEAVPCGLYEKFKVKRVDGSDKGKDKDYFVLDLNSDPHAKAAIAAYIASCRPSLPELASDLTIKYL